MSLSYDTSFSKAVKLADEVLGIEYNSGTDKAESIRIENTRGNKVKLVDLSVVYNSMTGIITAL